MIGGGISGLAAAWTLSRQPQVDVSLFEASDRVGGVLETIYDAGYLIERSADNFATLIPDALEFCQEIGFESQLIRPRARGRQAFVLRNGKIMPIPLGFSLMQPTRIDSMVTTQTLSWRGKLRLAKEYWVAARRDSSDESLESFVTRRLGKETFENLVEPIVSGIFTADPATLSMAATMPQFVDMERKHGGLIRGFLKSRKSQAQTVASRASGARYDQFMAPAHGMTSLVQHIVQSLPHNCLRLRSRVQSLRPGGDGLSGGDGLNRWMVNTPAGSETFDGVIVALPAAHAADLLRQPLPEIGQHIGSIAYASSAVVVMVVDKADIRQRIDGFGLIVPRKERRPTLAISYSSNKYEGRVPEEQLLLRIFLGGALAPELVDESDATLLQMAQTELKTILGWSGSQARWQAVVRWKEAMPQYTVGHLDRLGELDSALQAVPTLQVCGAAYRGVGIPQCVRDGRRAARAILQREQPNPSRPSSVND